MGVGGSVANRVGRGAVWQVKREGAQHNPSRDGGAIFPFANNCARGTNIVKSVCTESSTFAILGHYNYFMTQPYKRAFGFAKKIGKSYSFSQFRVVI